MPELIRLIEEYGTCMFNAGVYERGETQNYRDKAGKLFGTLKFLTADDAIEVPCPKCQVCSEAANRYCYNCGRRLKD